MNSLNAMKCALQAMLDHKTITKMVNSTELLIMNLRCHIVLERLQGGSADGQVKGTGRLKQRSDEN